MFESFKLEDLITYLETTSEESWLMGKCRSKDQTQHCLVSHIYNFAGGDEVAEVFTTRNGQSFNITKGSNGIDFFEERWATSYMFYPVNDGTNPNYPQATPKERCITYLKNLKDGKEKSTLDYWKEMDEILYKEKELAKTNT